MPRIEPASVAEAQQFLSDAIGRGHEGVMVKALEASYDAGRRGGSWLKLKPTHTLDLVVLAAEWGHGRRHGKLSNLHLGARDAASGGFVMLGKTFKGLTSVMLDWQTERCRRWRRDETTSRFTCARSSSSRSPSTACRRAAATPAGCPCGSRG